MGGRAWNKSRAKESRTENHMLLADVNYWLPGALLTILTICLVAWAIFWWRQSPLSVPQTLLWLGNYLLAKLLWGTQVEGQLPVEPGKGAVIVANHRSSVDPSFIQTSIRRVVYWMVAREYCQTPFLGWLLRVFQVIPVGRGGTDTAATKHAIRLAQEGGLVGMFPEGRINETADKLLLPGRPGAVLVALKARVPIIPIFISGSPYDGTALGPLRMRAHVRVKIGQPIDLSAYYGRDREEGVMQEITKRVLWELAQLAGHPEFEPQIAGRRWKTGEEDREDNNGVGEHPATGAVAEGNYQVNGNQQMTDNGSATPSSKRQTSSG
jgi:1-acyl-sn-glycerol-3-phosphate acyltransferase